jgi:hypothetical protein
MKVHQNVQSRRHIQERQEKGHIPEGSKAQNQQKRGPGPTSNRPREGGAGRRHLGCSRTPLQPLGPTLREAMH